MFKFLCRWLTANFSFKQCIIRAMKDFFPFVEQLELLIVKEVKFVLLLDLIDMSVVSAVKTALSGNFHD